MRVITWNLRRANKNSEIWDLILDSGPDIALLQEVGSISDKIKNSFDILSRSAVYKTGSSQKFSTAVLVKGRIIKEIALRSEYEWVNKELEFFDGNFISCVVETQDQEKFNVVSVYSPAWPVDKDRIKGVDVSGVKLNGSSEVWATEILWSALRNMVSKNEKWIVGGDYNSSETFDKEYQKKHGIKSGLVSGGNKEIRGRMYELGFKECLLEYNKKLTPTYKHSRGKVVHQLDHLYVSDSIFSKMKKCVTGEEEEVFAKSLSDHLPIIADFKNK